MGELDYDFKRVGTTVTKVTIMIQKVVMDSNPAVLQRSPYLSQYHCPGPFKFGLKPIDLDEEWKNLLLTVEALRMKSS